MTESDKNIKKSDKKRIPSAYDRRDLEVYIFRQLFILLPIGGRRTSIDPFERMRKTACLFITTEIGNLSDGFGRIFEQKLGAPFHLNCRNKYLGRLVRDLFQASPESPFGHIHHGGNLCNAIIFVVKGRINHFEQLREKCPTFVIIYFRSFFLTGVVRPAIGNVFLCLITFSLEFPHFFYVSEYPKTMAQISCTYNEGGDGCNDYKYDYPYN